MNGIQFGTSDTWKYGLSDEVITFDTGKQCLYVPDSKFDFILDKLTAYSTGYYQTSDGETVVSCGDRTNMQQVRLLVNNYWITISPTDYLTPIRTEYASVERSTGICRICVKKSWDTYWHVGTSAFTGYYSLWNSSRRTIAFYPLASGSKLEIEEGEKPDLVLGDDFLTIALLTTGNVISLGLLVLLVILAFFS